MKLLTKVLVPAVCAVAVSSSFAAPLPKSTTGYTFTTATSSAKHDGLQTTITMPGCGVARHHGEVAGRGPQVTINFNADRGNTMQMMVYNFPAGTPNNTVAYVVNGTWDNLMRSDVINFTLSGDVSVGGGTGTGWAEYLSQDKIPTDISNLCTAVYSKNEYKNQPPFTVLNPGKSISYPTVLLTRGNVVLSGKGTSGVLNLQVRGAIEVCNVNNTTVPLDPSNPSGPKKVGTLTKRGVFGFTQVAKGSVTQGVGG